MLGSFIKRELCFLGGTAGLDLRCADSSPAHLKQVSKDNLHQYSPFFRHQFQCAPNPTLFQTDEIRAICLLLQNAGAVIGTPFRYVPARFRRPSFIGYVFMGSNHLRLQFFLAGYTRVQPKQFPFSSISTRSQTVSNHLFFHLFLCFRNHDTPS